MRRVALAALVLVGCASAASEAPARAGRIFLVRHGESWKNVSHTGMRDDELDALTPRGRDQARAAGRFVAREFPERVLIASSPLNRAVETAELIRDAHRTYEVLGPAPLEPLRDGESPADGQRRAVEYVESILGSHAVGAVVVVTHADILALLLGKASGVPPADCWPRLEVPTGSVSEISVAADGSWSVTASGVVPKD